MTSPHTPENGFSLLEVLLSIAITLVIGGAVFHLHQQNESVFYDQNLISEMQQAARAAISQSADEIRMAGQGVPLYAHSFDAGPNEATVAILSGSSSTRINFRAGLAPAESPVTAPVPLSLVVGTPVTFTVSDVTGLYNAVGATPAGRYAYVWGALGAAQGGQWGWVRASIDSIATSTQNVRVTPSDTGSGRGVNFPGSPVLSLEEAIAIYYDDLTATVRRTTATDLSNPSSLAWAPANELVANATLLQFDYFDKSGNPVDPSTLAGRASVVRVDIRLAVQTAQDLTNRTRPTYSAQVHTMIRNALIH